MNKIKNLKNIIGRILQVVALICIIVSIIKNGNNIYLNIALLCICLNGALLLIYNRTSK